MKRELIASYIPNGIYMISQTREESQIKLN